MKKPTGKGKLSFWERIYWDALYLVSLCMFVSALTYGFEHEWTRLLFVLVALFFLLMTDRTRE